MRLVLGLSLTASSAVWVLVDTVSGKILAEEVVALDSVNQIARAAARSIQAFDVQTEHDIEGVRLTWTEEARPHGVRLRTKLRLFGFETVETVTQDAARDGRNKTARHLAPHLALAYGAARSDVNADETRNVLQRLTSRGPIRVAGGAACAAALIGVGVGLYAFAGPSPTVTPESTAAEQPAPQSNPAVRPLPAAVPPSASSVPQPIVEPVAVPAAAPVPSRAPEPVAAWQPAVTAVPPETATPEAATGIELDSTVPESVPVSIGVPHLPAAQPVTVPAQPVIVPAQPVAAPVPQPVTVGDPLAPLPPLPPVLSSIFDALP